MAIDVADLKPDASEEDPSGAEFLTPGTQLSAHLEQWLSRGHTGLLVGVTNFLDRIVEADPLSLPQAVEDVTRVLDLLDPNSAAAEVEISRGPRETEAHQRMLVQGSLYYGLSFRRIIYKGNEQLIMATSSNHYQGITVVESPGTTEHDVRVKMVPYDPEAH